MIYTTRNLTPTQRLQTQICVLVSIWLGFISKCLGAEITIQHDTGIVVSVNASEAGEPWWQIERSGDFDQWQLAAAPFFGNGGWSPPVQSEPFQFYRIAPAPSHEPPYTVAVIGDSTASGVIKAGEVVTGGWAEGLRVSAGPDTRILNAAEPGLTTKILFGDRRARLDLLIRTRPAFVMIQFGQVDEFSRDEENKSTTIEEFQTNLTTLIETIRGWNGYPILVTPLPWRVFDTDGSISTTLRDRADATLATANELGTLSVDFHAILSRYYVSITHAERQTLSAVDQYHFSEKGAEVGAGLLIDALPAHLADLLFERQSD